MLSFCNKSIILDINMDCEMLECLTTGSPICDDFGTLKNFFHEATLDKFTKLTVDGVLKNKHKNISVDTWQFYRFVRDWFKNSKSFKTLIPNWNIDDWFKDYLKSNIDLLESSKYECGRDFANDQFTYHEALALSTLKHMLSIMEDKGPVNVEPCIVFDGVKQYKPEFSWLVEDFLANRLNGKNSIYWKDIEPVLRANMRTFQFYTGIHGALDKGLINVQEWLTKLCVQDKILVDSCDFEEALMQETGIFLFQTPYMFHSFDTNFVYIKKLLERYRELRNGNT